MSLDYLVGLAIGATCFLPGLAIGFVCGDLRAFKPHTVCSIILGLLLEHGEMSGAELSKRAGFGVAQLYPALFRLEKLGCVVVYRPDRYGRGKPPAPDADPSRPQWIYALSPVQLGIGLA